MFELSCNVWGNFYFEQTTLLSISSRAILESYGARNICVMQNLLTELVIRLRGLVFKQVYFRRKQSSA